jgi:hypothetical protein
VTPRASERGTQRANASSAPAALFAADAPAPPAAPATTEATPTTSPVGSDSSPATPSAPATTSDAAPLDPLLASGPLEAGTTSPSAPPTDALGPVDTGPAPTPAPATEDRTVELPLQLLDPPPGTESQAIGQPAIDTLLGTDGRSFHVPVVLLLALGGYLSVQRRLGRGSLPMASTELPASVTVWRGQGDDDVRYYL